MIDVVMPQMGESIVEGTLTKWLKRAGERVERDEPLFEISTDKVDTEIPSPAAGVLSEILVEEGKTVGINTVVGRIRDSNGAVSGAGAQEPAPAAEAAHPEAEVPQPKTGAPPAAPAGAPAAAQVVEETAGPLSRLVRKMARENNIDLAKVKGTGAGGRITKQDLENYLAAQTQQRPAPSAAPQPQAPPPEQPRYAAPQPPPQPQAQAVATIPQTVEVPRPVFPGEAAASRIEPMSNMRQKIAEHMVFSKHTSAHVTTVHKVDMTRVAKMRER